MTSKELLYVTDALGHEQFFQTKCQGRPNQLQDAELKACVQQMAQSISRFFKIFMACSLIA